MTYIVELDPNSPVLAAQEAHAEFFDTHFPEWRVAQTAPEARDLIDYADVADPDVPLVWGYGGGHRVLIPGA